MHPTRIPARDAPFANAPASLDPRTLRDSFAAYPTGVVLVAAVVDERTVGMLASSFTSVSLEPPLVSISIARNSATLALLRRAPVWGISVLSERQQTTFEQLARRPDTRFAGVETINPGDGSALLPGASAHFVVHLESDLEAGDHQLLLLRVLQHARGSLTRPLIFHGSTTKKLAAAQPLTV